MTKKILNVFLISILFCIGCSSSEINNEQGFLKYVREITNSFCDEMKTEYGLYAIGTGGSMPLDKVNYISIYFNTQKKLDIAAARVLFIECTERLIKKINDNKNLREYLTNYPADDRNADLIISFKNAKGTRVIEENFLGAVMKPGRNILYEIFDEENNCLQTVYKEPYSEALEIVKKQKEIHD